MEVLQYQGIICLLVVLLASSVHSQEDYTVPIECYVCMGKAVNSTCADPQPEHDIHLDTTMCRKGACLKWLYYEDHELQVMRTCTERLNFHVTLDVVCRSERNDNGYICMCHRDLCNSSSRLQLTTSVLLLGGFIYSLLHC